MKTSLRSTLELFRQVETLTDLKVGSIKKAGCHSLFRFALLLFLHPLIPMLLFSIQVLLRWKTKTVGLLPPVGPS